MKRIALGIVAVAVALSGCAWVNRMTFPPDNVKNIMPSPYLASVNFKATADKTFDYEILGEGCGESTGYSIILGVIYHTQPDLIEAWDMAIKSRNGDVLLESRSQKISSGILAPVIYSKQTIKVRGLVAKIKNKPQEEKQPTP